MASGGYPPTMPVAQYDTGTQSTIALTSPNLSKLEESTAVDHRHVTRTPSPTPSEAKELARTGVFDWKELANWRFWFRREWFWYYVAIIIICVIFGLMTLYHEQIVDWLRPAAQWLHDLQFGWLVPIGILFVLSFPPLFGQEIVAVLCGLIWGLGIGFAIVSAGTLFGEIGNYYAFKYCCRARGEKLERESIQYGCLAKVVRDGGFWIALVARFSAIPGHFTTAVFATCGMGIIVFTIAAILSMPKQFITVYLGVVLEQSRSGEKQSTASKVISNVVLALTAVITVVAMWYLYHRMNKVKVEVIRLRRKRRQGKLQRASTITQQSPYAYPTHENVFASESTIRFESQTDIPLTCSPSRRDPNVKNLAIQAPQPQAYQPASFDQASFRGYDTSPSDAHDSASIRQDLYVAKPLATPDPYTQASFVPPGRTSTSSSRQPITPDAMYYTHSSPPPELPKYPPTTSSPPNFSLGRRQTVTSPAQPITYPTTVPVSESTSLPYAMPSSSPPPEFYYARHQNSDPYSSSASGHPRDATDATFVTAREPGSYEAPLGRYGGGHHQMETSDGPRYPGHF